MAVYTNGNDTPAQPDSDGTVYMLDGNDVVVGNASFIQSIHGGRGDDVLRYEGTAACSLYGDDGNDQLTGNQENDFLFGGDGVDIASGGAGVDFIEGGMSNDDCFGGSGSDFLYGGQGNDELFGEGDDDNLYGGQGNDALRGGSGADRMSGDDGDDGYEVTEAGDLVLEHADGGYDTVFASINYTLPANVEDLRMFPDVPINGTGNSLANGMTGNGTANTLNGMTGNDTLVGVGGNDTLRGDAGDDVLRGEAGNDTLIGGLGFDTLVGDIGIDKFDFDSIKETVKGSRRDVVFDFTRGQDRIDLSTIDATKSASGHKFKFIGKSKFHDEKGELRYIDKGSTVIVQGDVNGDGKADFEIFVAVGSLGKADFLL